MLQSLFKPNILCHALYQSQTLLFSTMSKGGAIVKAGEKMGLKQMFDEDSSTYTYMLWDQTTNDAILVDPVDLQVERDLEAAAELGLNLVYGVNTHAHADHITGTFLLKEKVEGLKSVISEASRAAADVKVSAGDRIMFGSRYLEVRATPGKFRGRSLPYFGPAERSHLLELIQCTAGHTEGCVSLVADDQSFVMTGDALLIQGCGRTDFQGGSSETLYDSVHRQLFTLPESCIVYPGHDYNGRTESSIGSEKSSNPRLGGTKSKGAFVEIMANLNMAYPKKIDVAVPANMRCGAPNA
jgi:sulfur dioxygenase